MSDEIKEAEIIEASPKEAIVVRTDQVQLRPRSMEELTSYAKVLSTSSLVPKAFQNRPGDIIVAIQMGGELGLSPIQSLQNIAVVNGKATVWGDSLLALCQQHPSYAGHEEFIEGEGDTMKAICLVHRKGVAKPIRAEFSVQDAKDAGLWGRPGPWTQYKKRMLQHRARGFALRDSFADALRGIITTEEARDYPNSQR